MEICNEIFNKSLLLASKTNKNFIIDQTNVLFHSRMEKLELFSDFFKEAIVLVLSESEQKKRVLKKERLLSKNNFLYPKLCKESYRNLQENFSLPDGEGFDKISYPELDEETSHKVVCLLNKISENEVHPLLREKNFNELKDQKISAASLKEAAKFDTETPITTQDVRAIMNQQHAFVSKKPERTSSVVSQPSIIYKSAQKTVYQAPPKPSPSYHRKASPSFPKPSYAPYKPVLSRAMPGLSSQKPMHSMPPPPPPPPPPQPKYSPRQTNQTSPMMSKPFISKPPVKNNIVASSPSLQSKNNPNTAPTAPVLRNYNSSLVRSGAGAGAGAGVGAGAAVGYGYGYGQQSGVSSGYGQSGSATNSLSGYGQSAATGQNVGERGQGYYGMGGSGIYGSSAGMYGVSGAATQGSTLSSANNNSYLQGQNSSAGYGNAYSNYYGYAANYSQANLSAASNAAETNYYSAQAQAQAQAPKVSNIQQPATVNYQGYYNQNYVANSNYQQQPPSNSGYTQQQTVSPNDFNYYYNQSYNNLMYSQAANSNSGAKIPNSSGTIINNSENNFWKNVWEKK